jgi:hypothetical protein
MGREIDELVAWSLCELEDSEVEVLKRWLGMIRTRLIEDKDRKA